MGEIITPEGEIIETLAPSTSLAVQLQKAEIDQQVTTAHAFPRSLKQVQSRIMSMATLDEESAEECMYALPRGGKPIRGPSVRFAEILKQSYGNCRAAARVVHVDRAEMFVEAEGVFHDLETNSATTTRVRRRISDKRGKIFNDDMIIVTGNAACAIAKRNAILDGIPKPLWRRAYETVQATITGDVTTLSENREKAFKALAAFGVKPEQVFVALDVEGVEDITVDHIATLRGFYAALKNGEATVEEMFGAPGKVASDHAKVENPLSDEPAKSEPKPADPSAAPADDGGDGTSSPVPTGAVAAMEPQEGGSSEEGENPGSVTTEQPAPSSESPDLAGMKECIAKLLGVATDKDVPDPKERMAVLGDRSDYWLGVLSDSRKDFVTAVYGTAKKVIKGELTAGKAREYLDSLVRDEALREVR